MIKRMGRYERLRKRRKPFLTLRHQRGRPSRGNVVLMAGLVSVVFVAVVICAVVLHRQRHVGLATAELLPGGGDVHLLAQQFRDGQVRFYRHMTTGGREVRFFVIQASDGVIHAAFDSCEFCYRQRRGYRQAGDAMVCNSCGRTFATARINVVQGGCNPTSLDRVLEGDEVRLKAASLELGTVYF